MCGDFFGLKRVIHAFNLGKPASCRSLWALLYLLATNLSWEMTPDIFRVHMAGPVETNLVKRDGVAYAFLHQHRLCP